MGAVKSNIGHLEGASGIAGLIKTIIILEKGIVPPNTNFEQVNPRIDLASLCIRVLLTPALTRKFTPESYVPERLLNAG